MTREQDFQRRLADWLSQGPSTAPAEVVDRAIEQTAGRRQRHPAWGWVRLPFKLLGRSDDARRLARLVVVAAVLAGVLLTSLLITVPLGGGPGPAPEMNPAQVRAIAGSAIVADETTTPSGITRVLDIEVGDARIDGRARQELQVLLDSEAGLHRSRGTMRLANAWGAWEGPVDLTAYPTGEEFELATLVGSGAYEGHYYLYTVHRHPSGADRAVAGAIWPDEPPPMPDPSLLP